jgi:predicted nucleotidyltransferase
MTLCQSDKTIILEEAHSAGIGSVYVFGSVLADSGEPRDIDVAVRDVPSGAFFPFYAALMRRLSKPVDVVDLGQESPVTELIAQDAVRLHE